MPTTPLLLIPYPSPNQNPWTAVFDAMINAIDASLYTPREDRNIIISGGGSMSFVASSGVLTWAEPISLLAAVTGYQWSIPAGQVTLNDGQLFYITVARAPQNNTTYIPVVGSFTPNQPNGDNQILVGIRIGTVVHFRDGFLIGDGQSMVIFDNTSVGGGGGGVSVQNSGTPLSGTFTTLNFDGAGVTATNLGGGVAKIEIAGGGGGGFSSFSQNCSAGSGSVNVVYGGPTPVPSQIILTGTPSAGFKYVMPNGTPFLTQFVNQTTKTVYIVQSTNLSVADASLSTAPPLPTLVQYDGSSSAPQLACDTPSSLSDATAYGATDGPATAVRSLGGANTAAFGQTLGLNVWGSYFTFQYGFGVAPPTSYQTIGQFYGPESGSLFYVDGVGLGFIDGSGEVVVLAPALAFFGQAVGSQLSTRQPYGPDFGDTIVGPSAIAAVATVGTITDVGIQDYTIHGVFTLMARVTSTTGSTETVGDMCTVEYPFDFTYTLVGTTINIQMGTPVTTSLSQTSSGTIVGFTFGVVQASPVQVAITVTAPPGIDPSTSIDFTVFCDSKIM